MEMPSTQLVGLLSPQSRMLSVSSDENLVLFFFFPLMDMKMEGILLEHSFGTLDAGKYLRLLFVFPVFLMATFG